MTLCLKCWLKLVHLDNSRYPKQCYQMLQQIDNVGRKAWATCKTDVLFNNAFGYVLINQEIGRVDIF